jgi:hypothetical protein
MLMLVMPLFMLMLFYVAMHVDASSHVAIMLTLVTSL